MQHELVISASEMSSILRSLKEGALSVSRPISFNRCPNRIELLVHQRERTTNQGELQVWLVAEAENTCPPQVRKSLISAAEQGIAVGLGIGTETFESKAVSIIYTGSQAAPLSLDRLRIIGPGMPVVEFNENGFPRTQATLFAAQGLYSRFVGTIGMQPMVRLQESSITLIGAGGNGSLFASHLARLMGRQGHLTIIDGDTLTSANLPAWAEVGEMRAQALVGRNKAAALAAYLQKFPDPPAITAIPHALLEWPAFTAIKRSDILVCCVDNPAARYVATFLSTLYLRPLIDVATGIFFGPDSFDHQRHIGEEIDKWTENNDTYLFPTRLPAALLKTGPRTMGADVRLTLADTRAEAGNCLLCLGGIGDLAEIKGRLSRNTERHPFWYDRAGSSLLLNGDAVNQGVRLLLALLADAAVGSEHMQMNMTLTQPPIWRRVLAKQRSCPLCARAGWGDSSCDELENLLSYG